MKIGINGYEAVVPRFGLHKQTGLPNRVGSSEYCFNLLVNLNKIDRKNEYFVYLPVNPTTDMPAESENWHYKIVKKRSIWTLFDLSIWFLKQKLFKNRHSELDSESYEIPKQVRDDIEKKEKLDIFFSPTHYLPIYSPFLSAISIMDLSYIHFPQLFKKRDLYQLKFWTKLSVRKAKIIFTISNASKSDIIKIYGVPKKKVAVTYPGIKEENIKHEALSMKDVKDKYGIEGEYILFVGTLQPRKNIKKLIEAFSKLSTFNSQLSTLNLVVVGKKGWMYEEILGAPKKFGIEDKVKFLDFVTDEELQALYKNALCFILPSLYEGFGLPVLEAMQNGCPVITSNISSLPEAGGDAALYVDPQDVNDIADKIQKVISNQKLRDDMMEKGYKQVKKFSWEKTARETLKALEEVGSAK